MKREIGEAIRREFHVSEAGLITVNDVDLAGDLKTATVFISILGNPDQQKRGFQLLNEHRTRLPGFIGRAVVMKYTPRLKFVFDDSIVRGNRVLQIIEELEKTSPAEKDYRRMKSYPKIIDRILNIIRESKTFCVIGHIRPDGDCVGSQLGLTLALQNAGKKAVCWNEDSLPQKYKFLNAAGLFQKPRAGMKLDVVIATDCASFERFGRVGKFIAHRKTLMRIMYTSTRVYVLLSALSKKIRAPKA